ncbi:aminopeptidase N [Paenalcaligenes suwonensis]|uniref:aminopeptidase N n=1 Tax=Paenalcaligenes suwonensis TaxID=1202713 RepID=UPI00140C8E29|nr:aminopeptidase N [Paenalcaligenes suwonensis]NHC61217.1 aminopeptidase N [Paenalcaligenes suwonensis]
MRTEISPTINRHDWKAFAFHIPDISLTLELDNDLTTVTTQFTATMLHEGQHVLELQGEELTLVSLKVNGQLWDASRYSLDAQMLRIPLETTDSQIEIISQCSPAQNSALMGLYVSNQQLFTQCEPEGFRRITWFADRPDVMSRYRVTLIGDATRYPLMLSNGNLIATKQLPDGRQQAIWEDPFPKPSYLFAVVAGNFDCREKRVNTLSGREVLLQVYSDLGDGDKTEWALESLERSLRWDEQRFGLELDLDRYMIVAARDFNMGAMENKGLNVFNSAYVLADPQTTTDASYRDIEAVIGHEYFHNWTGNRVTCRDWFQLSLKEGLTVFREQEFSADMLADGLDSAEAASAKAVKRIDDVCTLRVAQFSEDRGPMAHPIRPESYEEISNFYTATIYEKGAEVIRMQHTLLGEADFQAGIKEYFRRHDGQAVTCDDFIDAMDSVYSRNNPGKNLNTFRRWYQQAGTPTVTVQEQYDAATRQYRLTLRQHNPAVGIERLNTNAAPKQPLLIPIKMGLLNQQGQPLRVELNGEHQHEFLLELDQAEQSWTFNHVDSQPVLSMLRDFSAPVQLHHEQSLDTLQLLARFDSNSFGRWEAAQQLARMALLALSSSEQHSVDIASVQAVVQVWEELLQDHSLSPAYLARILSLPSVRELQTLQDPMRPLDLAAARHTLQVHLGTRLATLWQQRYEQHQLPAQPYSPDALSAGHRALKNLALHYLAATASYSALALAETQYDNANNMTDSLAALQAIVYYAKPAVSQPYLDRFYAQWQHNPLVVDRWFSVQACSPQTDVAALRTLMQHPAFTLRNPNRARSLIFQFCMNNSTSIHRPEGYEFWAEQVIALDALNPEIAARLARAFDNWAHYAEPQRHALHTAFLRLQEQAQSANVTEIIGKALNI